jgi:glutamate dehydrogenase (NADP+)
VAVSDSQGGVYAQEGLDVKKLIQAKNTGAALTAVGGHGVTNEELLELDVDILVPAALENQITEKNSGRIRARVVLELANGPVTSAADKVLAQKGITVLPDILANAGGVTVSYFEWVQNRMSFYWELGEIHEKLSQIMTRSAIEVDDARIRFKSTMRTAAYALAVERVARAIEAQGTKTFFGKEG